MGRNSRRVPGPRGDFLLYGATGYTGGLILRHALAQGLRPVVAGRDAEAITALAAAHRLEHAVTALGDSHALLQAVAGVPLVIHAAGPFVDTALPMVRACLAAGTDYVDITGEIAVFEALHALDDEARRAGIVLLPGAGFDVVPTDLLAAHLKRRLPSATHLQLAFRSLGGGVSRGTARTALASLGAGGAVRTAGRITQVPPAWRSRVVDFGFGTRPVQVTTIPWGDVSTAWHSTRIPDVEVYTVVGRWPRRIMKATRVLGQRGLAPVRALLGAALRLAPPGPDDEARARGAALVWGAAWDDEGRRVESRMRTPEGYRLTSITAVEAARRLLSGGVPPGFHTPSTAWGADWLLEQDGVEREDTV
jgi:short subunit dehydrogenase-like uncharacterized protein